MAWAPEGRGASRSQLAEGTRCLPCSARGHFCQAHEIIGGRAVCLHCLDGVDCPKTPRNGVAVARTMAAEDPAAHTMPQPALASGAAPSVAMPPRRVFLQAAKKMCLSCKRLSHSCVCVCSRGCGKPRHHRGACKGVVFGKAFPKAIAAGLSNAEAREMVALAEEITAGVEDEVKQRGAKDGATVTETAGKAKGIFGALEKEHAVFPVVDAAAALPVKEIAMPLDELYAVVDVVEIPAGRKPSIYEEPARMLKELPANRALTRTYSNPDIATTYREGIIRVARRDGLAVASKQDGSTIFIWRKA